VNNAFRGSEADLVSLKLDLVFVVNTEIVQALNLVLLDSLDALSSFLNLVTRALAILEVVKSSLFVNVLILADLLLNSLLMFQKGLYLFSFHFALTFFLFFLRLNDANKFCTFGLSHLHLHALLVGELAFASLIQSDTVSFFFLDASYLGGTVITFALLVRTFCAQLVNLSLAISCFFLSFA